MQQLINYIETMVKLDKESIQALESLVSIDSYKKNEYVLSADQYCNKIWFLKSGMIRKFYINNGNEFTCWIHTENDIFTSLRSYSEQVVSTEYLQACEDTVVISISRENSKKLNENAKFQLFSNMLMQNAFAYIDVHTREFASRNAKEKYEYLRIIAPEIVKRAKLGQIANILGISQETLSRIRKA